MEPERAGSGCSRLIPRERLPLALGIIPFVTTWLATSQGLGQTNDSVAYISAGLNLANGDGLVTYAGGALTIFPPGIPLLVALGELSGVGGITLFRVVNALSATLIVLLSHRLLSRCVQRSPIVMWGTAFVAVGTPVLSVASMAWSEPLFIVLGLGFLLLLEHALDQQIRWPSLAACIGVVWASFFVRYSALAFIAIGGVYWIYRTSSWGWTRRASTSIGFMASASLVPVLWMIRNFGVDGTLMGPRPPSIDTAPQTAYRMASTLGGWMLPLVPNGRIWSVSALMLAASVMLGMIRFSTRTAGRRSGALVLILIFIVLYMGFLGWAQLTTALNAVDTRLLAPVFVPVVVMIAHAVDQSWTSLRGSGRNAVLVATSLLVLMQSLSLGQDAWGWRATGRGYSSPTWKKSELAATARSLPRHAPLYSNQPAALWVLTGRDGISSTPIRRVFRSTVEVGISQDFITSAGCSRSYLAWFLRTRPTVWTPEELAEFVGIEQVSTHADGILYRFSPLTEASCVD